MRRLDAGTSAVRLPSPAPTWEDLGLPPPWPEVVAVLAPGSRPRPAQVEAFGRARALQTRRNLIVASPTNGGKSVVGHLLLLDAVARSGRAVLLEPLRALAREKYEELSAASPRLAPALGRPFAVRLSTGDYRLEGETFTSPPPAGGEVLVATPERLDAIARNTGHAGWLATITAVCVDEAHLLASPHRGPTLECLLTGLLQLPAPPRLVLLSASLGNLDRARAWLAPCDVARAEGRHPPLRKEVWQLSADESADALTAHFTAEALADPSAFVLVFVYQTRSAERLADALRTALSDRAGPEGPLAYHARMSAARRAAVRDAFHAGRCRCVVATTALGLGVNLPATHVLVRDTFFPGVGPLDPAELLQMMGRAGRADTPGFAAALVRPSGGQADDLARSLREERLPDLASPFDRLAPAARRVRPSDEEAAALVAPAVLGHLARHPETGLPAAELQAFFLRSLGGQHLAAYVVAALDWLTAPHRLLAYSEQGSFRPTTLGLRASRALLPLGLAAGFGQLVRDLLALDPDDSFLASWAPLDHLLVLQLFAERARPSKRFGEPLAARVDAAAGALAEPSVLFREWVRGAEDESRAAELLGSLGLTGGSSPRAAAYLAFFRALLLWERGQGRSAGEVESAWDVTGLEALDEGWRDETLWLLSGLARLLDVRCFYHHLRTDCAAGAGRVRRVRDLLRRMRAQAFRTRAQIKRCGVARRRRPVP
jgi:helicase